MRLVFGSPRRFASGAPARAPGPRRLPLRDASAAAGVRERRDRAGSFRRVSSSALPRSDRGRVQNEGIAVDLDTEIEAARQKLAELDRLRELAAAHLTELENPPERTRHGGRREQWMVTLFQGPTLSRSLSRPRGRIRRPLGEPRPRPIWLLTAVRERVATWHLREAQGALRRMRQPGVRRPRRPSASCPSSGAPGRRDLSAASR